MTESRHYVELHSRSAFSFLEGGSLPEELIAVAADLNLPAMALLDRNGFYGSPRFYMAGEKTGVRAHVGTELSVSDEFGTSYYPFLCESRLGYQNLSRLITKTKLRAPPSAHQQRHRSCQRQGAGARDDQHRHR